MPLPAADFSASTDIYDRVHLGLRGHFRSAHFKIVDTQAISPNRTGGPRRRLTLHDRPDRFEIEPLVLGAPWFDHPRNGKDSGTLMFLGGSFGEIRAEDIDDFSKMRDVRAENEDVWMGAMRKAPEKDVKLAIGKLLREPVKKDWGGESDDHFSANVHVRGERRTAAFLLKGPSRFRELSLEMCGSRADQIHRMVDTGADVCVVQHAHLIGPIVRRTLRTLTVRPGGWRRKYCLIDGQATYRILRAYSFL